MARSIMKVRVKSNYSQFIKQLRSVPKELDNTVREELIRIVENMCQDMRDMVNNMKNEWIDAPNGNMALWASKIDPNRDITYEINEKGNSAVIKVGEGVEKIPMADGNMVNPYMFIEFGFGIEGENNPAKYAYQNGWYYNLRQRKDIIVYNNVNYNPADDYWEDEIKWNVNKVFTRGTKGINFFYETIKKYRKELKKLADKVEGNRNA